MSYIVPRSIPKKCIHCDFSKLIASRDDEIECTMKGQNGETVLIGTVEHLDVERIISMHEKLARK